MDEREEQIIPHNNRRLQKTRTRRKLFRRRRQETFLEHLAATANVTESAAAAGVAVGTVYAHRMKDPVFRDAWAEALEQGYARLEAELMQRALRGPKPIRVKGDKPAPEGWALDVDMAMQLLREHKRGVAGVAKPGRKAKPVDMAAVRESILRKLRAIGVN